jgi:hypothetical protein
MDSMSGGGMQSDSQGGSMSSDAMKSDDAMKPQK